MVNEQFEDLPDFDPVRYANDEQYRILVDQARMIKDNEDEVKRSNPVSDAIEQNRSEEIQMTGNKQAQIQEEIKPSSHITENITQSGQDFKQTDFIEQEKYNSNSPIAKQANDLGISKPINSMWVSKGQVKRYLSAKVVFKIKEKNENRYRAYRYRGIGDDEIEILKQMAEDINLFYQLLALENNRDEDEDGNKRLVLLRNGKKYNQKSKMEMDYRRHIAFMCLGINHAEYKQLEQFSDPDFTVYDIWGINDIVDGILERSISGSSYFRIASKT